MKIEISKETYEFLKDYLKNADHNCDWELSALPPQHKRDNTATYQYWVNRKIAIRIALREITGE